MVRTKSVHKSDQHNAKIDAIDQKILLNLQANGRITNSELAKRVGLSPAPTLERVKKLERQGVITGYQARLDPGMVGVGIQTFVEVTLARHGHDIIFEFIKATKDIPEIIGCYYVTGRADFLLRVAARDMKDYENFLLHKLTTIPNIQHVETMIMLSNFKEQIQFPIALSDKLNGRNSS